MSIPATQLGWMAGVIDLRGRIVYKNNKMRATRQIVLMVESKNFDVIAELSRLTGTAPEAMKERALKDFMRRGCTSHCPEAHVHVEDERTLPLISRWTLTGMSAAVVLLSLEPFLRSNAEQMRQVIKDVFAQATLTGRGATQTLRSLERLHSLGWHLPAAVYVKMVEGVQHELTNSEAAA